MRIAFTDESGTDGKTRCYAIGALSFPTDRLDHFNSTFHELHAAHGVTGEVKWGKVGNSHGPINLALAWLERIVRSRTASFDVIVVNTRQLRLWTAPGANREQAFYKTYTFLLRHIARRCGVELDVHIDDRSDSYPLQHEAMEVIGNRMLAHLAGKGTLGSVTKVSSKTSPGVQVADLLTGAFAAGHRLLLDPNTPMNRGKLLALHRMAEFIGWDALHYDTYPNAKLNIWHFPQEFRANPATRRVLPAHSPNFVASEDLQPRPLPSATA